MIQEDVERIARAPLPWERFEGKTVLITGANGFLPAYMVEVLTHLSETGAARCRVLALVRSRAKAEARFPHLYGRSDFKLIVQDVCSPVDPGEKVDYIVHAASQASPKFYGVDPVGTLLANTLGTSNLLSLARAHQVEGFLFFSSGDVYGRIVTPEIPIREDDYGPLDPTLVRSCYGESKRLGETMCACYSHQYSVPVRMVRPASTYGPGMALDDGRVFADFTANILRHENIVIKSAGLAQRSFCYLADAVEGYFTLLLKGGDREPYNVGNEDCYVSIAELAQLLTGLFPERGLRVEFQQNATAPGYLPTTVMAGMLDSSKLRALGWKPSTGLEEGFRRTVRSYEV